MRILVALDGSQGSRRALRFALKLAKDSGYSVSFIHVVPKLPTTKEELIRLIKEEIGSPQEAGERYLEEAKKIAEEEGVRVQEVILREGNPVEEILKAEKEYDLVVVGSRGMGRVDRLLLGSVSSKLVVASTKPVLVVR
ncbi:universal stress protein [Candidatus Pyrohabitans sp.]